VVQQGQVGETCVGVCAAVASGCGRRIRCRRVFGLAYLVASLSWSGLSSGATATVAGLIAAPLALGLVWSRLTGFKAFGIEVMIRPDSQILR
jgi:hypothetical protein